MNIRITLVAFAAGRFGVLEIGRKLQKTTKLQVSLSPVGKQSYRFAAWGFTTGYRGSWKTSGTHVFQPQNTLNTQKMGWLLFRVFRVFRGFAIISLYKNSPSLLNSKISSSESKYENPEERYWQVSTNHIISSSTNCHQKLQLFYATNNISAAAILKRRHIGTSHQNML